MKLAGRNVEWVRDEPGVTLMLILALLGLLALPPIVGWATGAGDEDRQDVSASESP